MINNKKNYHLSSITFTRFFFLTSLVQIKIDFVKRKENSRKRLVILKK